MLTRYQARLYELRSAPIIRPLSDYVLVYREATRLSAIARPPVIRVRPAPRPQPDPAGREDRKLTIRSYMAWRSEGVKQVQKNDGGNSK